MEDFNLASLNLCLGLSNKKDMVTRLLNDNNISVCCMQETEIPNNYPELTLNCNGYDLELELSTNKKRSGIYLKNGLNYLRRNNLERKDFHIVVVDINLAVQIRIICIYRSFRPPNQMTPDNFFLEQLKIIRNALCKNCYILGDFNLDANMTNCLDYGRRIPLKFLTDFALENNLSQIVNFNTWTRTINGAKKESLLDHIYVNNPASVNEVTKIIPTFGGHSLVVTKLNFKLKMTTEIKNKRIWGGYSVPLLNSLLTVALTSAGVNWPALNVQEHWNCLEMLIVKCTDECAPIVETKLCYKKTVNNLPPRIKTIAI